MDSAFKFFLKSILIATVLIVFRKDGVSLCFA